jgi:hypothetical protein
MQEINGNIWTYHYHGRWIIVTTNGAIKTNGAAVMGRGVAKELAIHYPDFPGMLGAIILSSGNNVYAFAEYRVITFPVKNGWRKKADLALIQKSLRQLVELVNKTDLSDRFYMVRPGCGYGRLDWETEVKHLCERYLDNRFIITHVNEIEINRRTKMNIPADAWIPEDDPWETEPDDWATEEGFDYERIKQGVTGDERIHALHQYEGYLVKLGYTRVVAKMTLIAWNANNRPIIPMKEFEDEFERCWKLWNGKS